MRLRPGLLAPLALIACAPVGGGGGDAPAAPPTAPQTVADPAACGADALQSYVGQPATAAQQAAGFAIVRVYARGDAVSTDFLPERLNIVTDGEGTVVDLLCG